MSGEIMIQADVAASEGKNVIAVSGQLGDQMTTLRNSLTRLSASFRGQTAENWDMKLEELNTAHAAVIEALDWLGAFLVNTAATMTEVDSTLAAQLSG